MPIAKYLRPKMFKFRLFKNDEHIRTVWRQNVDEYLNTFVEQADLIRAELTFFRQFKKLYDKVEIWNDGTLLKTVNLAKVAVNLPKIPVKQ